MLKTFFVVVVSSSFSSRSWGESACLELFNAKIRLQKWDNTWAHIWDICIGIQRKMMLQKNPKTHRTNKTTKKQLGEDAGHRKFIFSWN